MAQTRTSQFQRVLDIVEKLSAEEQAALIDVIQQRLALQRREEIARHASETLQSVKDGTARYGSLDDLKEDLLADS